MIRSRVVPAKYYIVEKMKGVFSLMYAATFVRTFIKLIYCLWKFAKKTKIMLESNVQRYKTVIN